MFDVVKQAHHHTLHISAVGAHPLFAEFELCGSRVALLAGANPGPRDVRGSGGRISHLFAAHSTAAKAVIERAVVHWLVVLEGHDADGAEVQAAAFA